MFTAFIGRPNKLMDSGGLAKRLCYPTEDQTKPFVSCQIEGFPLSHNSLILALCANFSDNFVTVRESGLPA
jgi:hypothetical protein